MHSRKAAIVRLAATYPKGSEERLYLLKMASKEYTATVSEIRGSTVVMKGDGHAALKEGLVVPSAMLGRRPKIGDDYFAEWKPGPGGGKWSFAYMDFNL